MAWLLVAIFGGLGAVARYLLDRAIMSQLTTKFPVGTLVINLSGALLLGVAVGLATRGILSADESIAIGDGFIGAYTTFSTLMFESLALASEGSISLGAINTLGTVVLATFLAYLGIHLAH